MTKRLLLILTAALTFCACRPVLRHPDWAPDVRRALCDFIKSEKEASAPKYVVFDFDNTCSIFDISEQLMIYQLETMCFPLTPEGFAAMAGHGTESYPEALQEKIGALTAAYGDLYARFGPFTAEGVGPETAARLQEDPVWKDFAVEMGRMYGTLQEYMSEDDAYLWVLGWFTGLSREELYDMSMRSHLLYGKTETAVRSWTGTEATHSWTDGISVTDNIRELWKVLDENGFDIWVCSASEIGPVMAAVDAFGLHDWCTGVLAMTMATDGDGRYLPDYDYETGCGFFAAEGGGWIRDTVPTRTQPSGPGKVEAVRRCLVPRYGGKGPSAGFMDATGDFNFCTEFSSMRLCVCFNRATRKVTDGGGLVAETALYEKEALHYNLRRANRNGDILYVLQGRDENGLRSFRPSNATLRLGATEPRLLAGEENEASLAWFKEHRL